MKTILFVGGGSIGHVAPSVAVANSIREHHPECLMHFICGDQKVEADFIVAHGFSRDHITPSPSGVHPILGGLFAFHRARKTMKKNPDVIFSKGGALSGSVCLMAKVRGIPVILHESDAVMGRANTLAIKMGLVHIICTGFPHVSHHSRTILTGNPVRTDIVKGSRGQGLALTGFLGRKPILLILGGSQGAQFFNEAVRLQIDSLLRLCDIIHITGEGKAHAPEQLGYWHAEFVHQKLPHLYATADFAMSRAGAGSIGELAANAIPTILVPLRGVGHDHQYANARALEKESACIHIPQEELAEKLVGILTQLIRSPNMRETLAQNLRKFATPNASGHIAKIILQCIEESAGDA
ncbi:hypothetical protein A2635_04565 [Candidatus Peribacteria bacterium RIFCSPHIGHO2_01_FULL_51_9]|nr:MAG: hypothetical protein A2635_04565 [Candidatus Peribacteria bacterium RIFCSPHIGHO2_01_FULL_51_9]